MLTRTYRDIAQTLRKDIGAHVQMIGMTVAQDDYLQAQARSDRAQHLAQYLTDHLANVDRFAFANLCGIPAYAKR